MGLEFVRGNSSRYPPLLVGGILIMCLILLSKWWSLSSENSEVLKQNSKISKQLEICAYELDKCREHHGKEAELEIQIKQLKESNQELELQCQKLEEIFNIKQKNEIIVHEKEICQREKESLKKLGELKDKAIKSLSLEKSSLLTILKEKEMKLVELMKKIAILENAQMQQAETMKQKLVKLTGEKPRSKSTEKNMKITNNISPFVAKKLDSVLSRSENHVDVKNDNFIAEPRDSREEEMGVNATDV